MIMVRSHAGSTHSGSNCSASDIARSINDMIITLNPAMRLQTLCSSNPRTQSEPGCTFKGMHASVLCKCLILLACVGATTPFQAVHVALQPGASCTHHAAGWRARAVSGRSARASPRALAATAATTAATTAASQSLRAPPCPKDARVLVVFTGAGDLRLHDHGGLAAAAAASEIHCMAVLDPVLLARVPNRRIRALVSAVRGVGSSLAELGINLDVRMGAARQVSAAAATEAQATHVYLHSDPESSAQQMLQDVAAGVTDARPRAETHLWNAALRQGPLQEREDFESYQASLGKASARLNSADRSRDLLAQRAATAAPPFELPPDLLDKLLAEVEKVRGGERARAFALRELSGGNLGDREETSEALALDLWERYKTLGEKAFAHSELVPALSSPSLEHISARVYGPDGYAHGEAFLRVFSEALALGCLSPRKVMQESNDALWSEGVVPFILANQGRRALHMARSAVEAREWHRVLAVRDTIFDPSRTDADSFTYHYWRWKGFLVRYLHSPMQAQGDRDVGGVERSGRTGRDRPALVLVHGFGASADQWHRLIAELGGEYDVWALDLLGFGHSEKPTLSYTQFLWEDVVRDFVLECVQVYIVRCHSIYARARTHTCI